MGKIGKKEEELISCVVDYVKRKNIEKEDGLAIVLLCDNDKASDEIIEFLRENPDVDFYDLFLKAVDLYKENKQNNQ